MPSVLEKIVKNCPELSGITLSGWENLNADHIKYLASNCRNLQRVNLSGVSVSVDKKSGNYFHPSSMCMTILWFDNLGTN